MLGQAWYYFLPTSLALFLSMQMEAWSILSFLLVLTVILPGLPISDASPCR